MSKYLVALGLCLAAAVVNLVTWRSSDPGARIVRGVVTFAAGAWCAYLIFGRWWLAAWADWTKK